jgi:hypothetical protein
MPLRIAPDLADTLQDSDNSVSEQCGDVLQDNPWHGQFVSKSERLSEQPAARSGDTVSTVSMSGAANVLAGEACCNDINGNAIGSKSFGGKLSHVSIAGDVGPMLCKDTAGKLLYFAKGNGLKTARALQAKAKAADPAKKIKNAQHLDCAGSERGNGDNQDNASQSGFRHGVKVLHVLPFIHKVWIIGQRRQAVIIGWGHAASPWLIVQKSLGKVTPRSAARRAIAWRKRHGMLREGSRQLATAPGETFKASATILLPPNWSRM